MEIITLMTYAIDLAITVRGVKGGNYWDRVVMACKGMVVIPFAVIFSELGVEPRWVVVILSLLRLLDWTPISRIGSRLLQRYIRFLNLLRILTVILLYIIISHIIACLWIEMAKLEDDSEKSWIRRIPVPRPQGTRAADSMSVS